MQPQHLPILQTIARALIDVVRAIRAMPLVAVCALAVQALAALGAFLAIDLILQNSGRSVSEWLGSPAWLVAGVLDGGLRIILLAPFAIAIHRFVIRGEAARRYPLQPLRPSYQRYVGTAFVLVTAFRTPDLIALLLPPKLPFVVDLWIFAMTALLMVVLAVALLQRITLFAAIAVHAPRATWRDTEPAGAGNVLRTVAVLAGVLGPCFVASIVLRAWLLAFDWSTGKFVLVLTFTMALVQYVALCAMATATSRIHLAIGVPLMAAQTASDERPALA
jgi:hypothetical protein